MYAVTNVKHVTGIQSPDFSSQTNCLLSVFSTTTRMFSTSQSQLRSCYFHSASLIYFILQSPLSPDLTLMTTHSTCFLECWDYEILFRSLLWMLTGKGSRTLTPSTSFVQQERQRLWALPLLSDQASKRTDIYKDVFQKNT